MNRRLFAAGVALTQVFLTPLISLARAQQPSDEDTALLETIITQHEATVLKIASSPLFAESTWRSKQTLGPTPSPNGEDLSGPMVVEGRVRSWRDGTSFCEDREQKNTWPDSGRVHDLSKIFMINDRYAVEIYRQNPVLNLYHFDDRNNLDPAVKAKVDFIYYPDVINFGVRFSSRQTLREAYEGQSGGGKEGYGWSILEHNVDGNLHYKIVVERIDGETRKLQKEIVLDPRSGYLITESRTYNKAGEPFYVVQARFEQVADGLWFPKSVTRNIEQGNHVATIEVEKVTLGDPEIGKMITLEALEIDRDSILMIEHANGAIQETRKGYLDGQWVPFDSLPPERKDAINDARRKANAASQDRQRISGMSIGR